MKIAYKHIVNCIDSKPSIEELSDNLFQLGHEHEISNDIFDMEFTPNRGDCLSIKGILRDLKLFYDISIDNDIYENDIEQFSFEFNNKAKEICSNISFLKVEINEIPLLYKDYLNDFFSDLNIKKNNFFTDVSNYVSYETGQPTHCYDSSKVNEPIKLDFVKEKAKFETLLDKTIEIDEENLVFVDKNNEIINLAGVIGGKYTSCNKKTKSVIIECAHFNPEAILGKSVRYGISSEAAHKFERNTDLNNHDYTIRRLLKIIEDHAQIQKVEIFSENNYKNKINSIMFDVKKINKILGTSTTNKDCIIYLQKLGFLIKNDEILIPSYRNDVKTINDIAEEVARAIGYNNIKAQNFDISLKNNSKDAHEEKKLKDLLINEGFYEVINDPFISIYDKKSIIVDNPLDSNRKYLRTNLKNSLLKNLTYNERRQKETIKLFEIADIYTSNYKKRKRVLGIVASGRVDKNYQDFSKKINNKYIENMIVNNLNVEKVEFQEISRDSLDSKSKETIVYTEIDIEPSLNVKKLFTTHNEININNKQYVPISDFPSSKRDLSFSIKDFSKCKILEKSVMGHQHKLLKETFIFDYFKNEKIQEIKIGFRFIFQSKHSTITDNEVNDVMDSIIANALKISSVTVPGLT